MLRVVLPLALAGALAGCGIGTVSDGSLPTVAASPEPMPAQACQTAQLTATAGTPTAGTIRITLTNTGGLACTLRGAPAVALLDATGAVVARVAADPAGSAVRVARGAAAVTSVGYPGVGADVACRPVVSVRLAAPGDAATEVVPAMLTVCGTPVTVTPFAAG